MHEIINYIVNIVGELGYTGIFIMMVIESSFFPFPSEIAMVPAGYLASIGKMNFIIAFLIGTLGAIIGATINYFLAKKLGLPIVHKLVHKYGKYIFLNISHFDKAEKYFLDHGSVTTFIGRFIPAVRQLISLPAGAFKMNIAKFLFYTGLGAGIWNLILMAIGYIAGENRELISQYSKEALIGVLVLCITIGIVYFIIHKKSKNGK